MLLGAVVCSGGASSSQRDAKIGNLGAKSGNVGWAMYNMTYDGVRSSPLSEINVGNVQNLRQLCRVKLGEGGTLHASPVVVGDTLYMTTAHSTVALDATSCKLIWRFVDPATKADALTRRCIARRLASQWGARIWLAFLDPGNTRLLRGGVGFGF